MTGPRSKNETEAGTRVEFESRYRFVTERGMRNHAVVSLLAALFCRVGASFGAEPALLEPAHERDEVRRSLDATWGHEHDAAPVGAYAGVLTAGDLLARSTALGYDAALVIPLGDARLAPTCGLHDAACGDAEAGATALGLEIFGVLGDSGASLDPLAQPHQLAAVATVALSSRWILHATLAVELLGGETVGQLLLAREL
jgi:hypothetical protein